MPPIARLEDQNQLVTTSSFPTYASFPFEKFNPVQSRIFEVYDQDANIVIAAATSAGKTICAEFYMSHEVRKRGGKAMYLAPLRALAKEKIDDWTDKKHHFADLNLSICTGDYRLTPSRKKELEAADIILMTSEMLNSRCRNYKSEVNDWIKSVGTIIVDESHLLTVPSRGDHLEVGLMKFCQIAPHARLVFLSATMPNVQEVAEWVSYTLTGRKTYLIDSKFRPCPLGIHWHKYEESWKYEATEEQKVDGVLDIIGEHPDDKFLVFVHTKRTGEMVKRELTRAGIDCEYHNADLEKEKRHEVESRFRSGKLRAVVATSTLAWGLNLPARRVIITGIHRGLQEVDTYDIFQMAGRAGRPGYDPRGDVYILLPRNKYSYHLSRLSKPQDIVSRLLDHNGEGTDKHYKTLAFHLVSEIHHGEVRTKKDVHKWFERSLAFFQAQGISDDILDNTLELLIKFGAIREIEGRYEATSTGTVSSMFYYSPFDVADLRRNFSFVFREGHEDADIAVSMALGNIDTIRMGFVSKAEAEEMGPYTAKVNELYGHGQFKDAAIKGGYAYFTLLHGLKSNVFSALARGLQFDFPRTATVLKAIDSMSAKWEHQSYFNTLELRVAYGVNSNLVDFCRLPQIGKVRAERLYAAGFRSLKDVVSRPAHVQNVLNLKQDKIDEIMKTANGLLIRGV